MTQEVTNQITQLGIDALSILIPVLAGMLANVLRKHSQNQTLVKVKSLIESKQLLAQEVVLFVQQTYKNTNGDAKYTAALNALSAKLATYKITVTETELDTLIHSALKALKLDFGDAWKTVGQEPEQSI